MIVVRPRPVPKCRSDVGPARGSRVRLSPMTGKASAVGRGGASRPGLRAAAGRHGQPGARSAQRRAALPPPRRAPHRPVLPAAVRRALPRPAHGADDEAHQLEAEARAGRRPRVWPRSASSRTRSSTSRRSSTRSPRRSAASGSPATSSAAATRRPTASCAPSSRSATTCRRTCGAASSRSRAPTARGFASPGRGRTSRRTSTTSAS